MEESILPQISILIGLIILSGLFSGSETALVSLSPARLRVLLKSRKSAAKTIEKLKRNPQKLLITILVGNNLVNIAASGIATLVFTDIFGSKGLGIATGIMTFFVLIFGEITPKTFAETHAESFALTIARPIRYLQIIILPIIWVLEKITHFFFWIFKIDKDQKPTTEDELRALLTLTREGGEIDAGEHEYIKNILDLDETLIGEIMTPRAKILILPDTTTINESLEFFHKNNRSRIPVYHNELENIVGYFSVRNLLLHKNTGRKKLNKIKLPQPIIAPETMPARNMFSKMRSEKCHIAMVMDEHGSVTGLVTMEDILEEIVGEIYDETDREGVTLRKLGKNIVVAGGDTELSEINNILKTRLGKKDRKTVALLVLEKLGRFPKPGESIKFGKVKIIVQKISRNRIERVRIMKK